MCINENQIVTYIFIFLACSVVLNLVGCSTYSEIKAPCNYAGTMCGTKIAINN